MEEGKGYTNIDELGEFGLIKHLSSNIGIRNKEVLKGIGDDAAIIDIGNGDVLAISTDLLTEGVHFDLVYCPLKHLGYKAVSVNLSDILAMNCKPTQITFSIALSSKFPVEALDELYAGAEAACERYGVDLVGGDTTSSKAGLTIAVTAIGRGKKEEVVYRDGAKDKDLIVVSGDLGGAYMGLQILERERLVFKETDDMQPDLTGYDYVLERQLKPEPRIDIIDELRKLDIKPTSMIDISDGLASELLHLADQSKLSCQVYEDKLPITSEVHDAAKTFNLDPTLCALNGGEDYELLFTINQSEFEKIKDNKLFHIIGYMDDASVGSNLIDKGNHSNKLTAQGWDALLNKGLKD
jgi:thiamine-monophosphate kinase